MRNQEIREFLEASKRNGWELTQEKVVRLLNSGITLNDAFISSSIIMPTRQEVEDWGYAWEDWESIRSEWWYLSPMNIRYLLDNGFDSKKLKENNFDPDRLESNYCDLGIGLQYFLLDCGYRYKLRGGTPIDNFDDLETLAGAVLEKFGYQLTDDDKNMILRIDMSWDDVNWDEDYSHRYNPKIYGSVRSWAENEYIGLIPPQPTRTKGIMDMLEPGEVLTF